MKDSMNPRERWLTTLRGEKPDRIPTDYWATEEVTQELMEYLDVGSKKEICDELHIDNLFRLEPDYAGPSLEDNVDEFGIKYKNVDYGHGEYSERVYHPLAQFSTVKEIKKNYSWPSPDYWDYSVLEDKVKGLEEYPIEVFGSEPFLTYTMLRGQERAYKDLISKPDIAHYCLDKLFELCYEKTRRSLEVISDKTVTTCISEDMGSQVDLLFSPEKIREFLLPRMKEMIELAHQADTYVFHHNDGNIEKIIPDLIDIGIDVLNPIQWRCLGISRQELKNTYGGDLDAAAEAAEARIRQCIAIHPE